MKKRFVAIMTAPICCAIISIAALVGLIRSHAMAQTSPPTITIANVVGLANALNLRPQMGVAYQAGRAVVIDQYGQLEGVTGALSDCVLVNGVSGPCGSSGISSINFADSEVPAGAQNGSNLTFTVQAAPNPSNSLKLYRNGIRLSAGSDYHLVGNVVTLVVSSAPLPSDTLVADYRY